MMEQGCIIIITVITIITCISVPVQPMAVNTNRESSTSDSPPLPLNHLPESVLEDIILWLPLSNLPNALNALAPPNTSITTTAESDLSPISEFDSAADSTSMQTAKRAYAYLSRESTIKSGITSPAFDAIRMEFLNGEPVKVLNFTARYLLRSLSRPQLEHCLRRAVRLRDSATIIWLTTATNAKVAPMIPTDQETVDDVKHSSIEDVDNSIDHEYNYDNQINSGDSLWYSWRVAQIHGDYSMMRWLRPLMRLSSATGSDAFNGPEHLRRQQRYQQLEYLIEERLKVWLEQFQQINYRHQTSIADDKIRRIRQNALLIDAYLRNDKPTIVRLLAGMQSLLDMYPISALDVFLMLAIDRKEVDMVEWLLDYGADAGFMRDLPLRTVVASSNRARVHGGYPGGAVSSSSNTNTNTNADERKLAELLLRHGADLHVDDDFPFRESCRLRKGPLMDLLLDFDANPRAKDDEAFRWTVRNGDKNLARFFLHQLGSDANAAGGEAMRTAIIDNRDEPMGRLLMRFGATTL